MTFDQPLYQKASEIVATSSVDLGSVIVRLGGFHLLMSFMGAVGNIMAGSVIEDLWSRITVCAPSSVPHMSTGHAFARALRAHFLTQEALATIILKNSNILDASKEKLSQLYECLMGDLHFQRVLSSDDVTKLFDNLNKICNEVKESTA